MTVPSVETVRPTLLEYLRPLHALRTARQIVLPTMGSAREWMKLGAHPLDFIYAPSAMGQAPNLGLGLALACPDLQVIVLTGDGCQLLNLGSFVTVSGLPAPNFLLIVCNNGAYEVTGNQATAASCRPVDRPVDFGAIASGCGIPSVFEFRSAVDWERQLPEVLSAPGPTVVVWQVAPDPAGTVPRSPAPAPVRAREFARTLAARVIPTAG